MNKRYELNRAALEHGFDVLVTGHNLDDEVATLFGNVLHWNTDMLGRQAPVLEERVVDDGTGKSTAPALVRKVKPLVRVAERETAAYALIKGIDYIVEECPMVEGNTQHRFKDALTSIEEASPGTKHQMYFGFLARAADRFRQDADATRLVACEECGAPTVEPTTSGTARCTFCKTKATAHRRREAARARGVPAARRGRRRAR